MFTHKLDPRTGKYVRLQTMQLKRLNGIFSLNVSDANTLAKAKSVELYKNSPMLFPSYVDAYCTCTQIIIEMIKVQSLRKVTAFWPMLLSLGTADGWTFQDLVKTRRDYHEALRLLMSYVVVVESWDKIWGPVPETNNSASDVTAGTTRTTRTVHTMPQLLNEQTCVIGLPAYEPAVTRLEDALRAELVLPDHKYRTNFLCALKTLNQAEGGPDTCHS